MDIRPELQETLDRMENLKKFCLDNRIPLFAIVMDDNDDNKYYSAVVSPTVVRRPLTHPDKITKFNAAMNNQFYIKVARNHDNDMAEVMDTFM